MQVYFQIPITFLVKDLKKDVPTFSIIIHSVSDRPQPLPPQLLSDQHSWSFWNPIPRNITYKVIKL